MQGATHFDESELILRFSGFLLVLRCLLWISSLGPSCSRLKEGLAQELAGGRKLGVWQEPKSAKELKEEAKDRPKSPQAKALGPRLENSDAGDLAAHLIR